MPTHKDYIEECARVFVPWRYMVAIVLSLVVGVVTVTVFASSSIATVEERSLTNKKSIEVMQHNMDKKLDIILRTITKEKN